MTNDWKIIQDYLQIKADGIPGPKTCKAIKDALGLTPKAQWPTQAEVRSGKSLFGQAAKQSALTTIQLPYPMRLSWELGTTTTKLRCHEKIAQPLLNIFTKALRHYGIETIQRLGLDILGGCFNNRAIIGGKAVSMHAWGIAIDLDPERNGLNTHAPQARFSHPDYDPFWDIVQAEGAISLGRERDYDWMHFQFATLD